MAIAIGVPAYFALGVLAMKYGASAPLTCARDGATDSLIAVGVLAAAFALSLIWPQRAARLSERPSDAQESNGLS